MATWHILTGEYPPDVGGVADYTATIAQALHDSGDCVHVWTAGSSGSTSGSVSVHRVFGGFSGNEVAEAGRLIARANTGRLLVQWVPQAFGRRGVNLPFALWLHARSVRKDDPVDVMVHEPFVPLKGSVKQRAAAVAQRAMTALVLHSATRGFAGTPAWIDACKPFAPRVPFRWTPIPTGVTPVATADDGARWRQALRLRPGERVIGCFGRGGEYQERRVEDLARELVRSGVGARIVLIGLGSETTRERIGARCPELKAVIAATGTIDHADVSAALRACDVMALCHADGVCSRHSSGAAVLAHGCAAVANAGRFTERIWRDSGAVALVQSPDEWPRAVVGLLDDPRGRARLSQAALALYDSTFDVRHTVAALKN